MFYIKSSFVTVLAIILSGASASANVRPCADLDVKGDFAWGLIDQSSALTGFVNYNQACRELCGAGFRLPSALPISGNSEVVTQIESGLTSGLSLAVASYLGDERAYCFPSEATRNGASPSLGRYRGSDTMPIECFRSNQSNGKTEFTRDYAPNGFGVDAPILCVRNR